MTNLRIGFGYDTHQLVENRAFILGGIKLDHPKGLLGHSDADVLLHAITDAILGAASLGDIGALFPDTDMAFKNADSKILLAEAFKQVQDAGFDFVNTDVTVILEKPKLRNRIDEMRAVIANILKCELDRISLKATTNEKMGFVGRGEGCVVMAVAMLEKKEA
ncbi:2-C-methyl-D-erythritol 2,4-cyclodiphosphate synthase [bacterium]|nr:MAG: 2-C-methyl-D-erythritol 2,4-cyclodiphosphate synthase [bacterium]